VELGVSRTSPDGITTPGGLQAGRWRGGRGMPGTQLPGCRRKTTGARAGGLGRPGKWAFARGRKVSFFYFLFNLSFLFL